MAAHVEAPALRVLYGGTFDPVHLGHVAVARAARGALGATVAFMPAADPPHRAPPGAPATDRAAMLELAIAGEPGLSLDLRELERDGRSWTVDTLRGLRAEIGYILGRAHWSRGYVSEALPALIDHGFETLGLNRLEADIDPRNAASARVLMRLGFVQEGLLRERWVVRGEPSDSALYGLLLEDWLDAAPRRSAARR